MTIRDSNWHVFRVLFFLFVTLFATKSCHFDGQLAIQCSAIDESDQRNTLCGLYFNDAITFFISSDNYLVPHSSNRGKDWGFNGATRDFEQMSLDAPSVLELLLANVAT